MAIIYFMDYDVCMDAQIKTLRQAIVHFADRENCRKFMVFLRWPDGEVKCLIAEQLS